MKVFLTGGTGLIGSHVAAALRARGDQVVALVRSTSETPHLESLGCRLVTGDIGEDAETLAAAMRGCDAVIHAAAKVFQRGSRADFLRANVEGTERVLSAAALAAPRVVLLSSVAVYAGLGLDRPLTERRWTDADPAHQNAYAASKHLAERAAWRLHERGGIRLTTVRPSVVYGERDRAATPILVRYATLPVVPLLGGGRATLPLVYAENVARGVVEALHRDAAIGRAYNLAQDEPITLRQAIQLTGEALGRRTRTVGVPAGLARGAASLVDGIGGVVPFARRTGLKRALRSLVTENPYDSARARLELGWRAAVSHREGIRRTMAWWSEGGRDR